MEMLKHITGFYLIYCLVACTAQPAAPSNEPPMMTQERPRQAASVAEAVHNSGTESHFESLIADYESHSRAIWQKPELVMSLLGDISDKTIVDIGVGTGYFTFRLVSKAKQVIGVDIDPQIIAYVDSVKVRLPEPYKHRLVSRLGAYNDPRLLPEEADAATIVNTYGYIENRVDYLKILAKGLKNTDGRLLIIDFKRNNIPVGPSIEYKVSVQQVEQELVSAGFKILSIDSETLDYQYIIMAKKDN